MNAIISMIAALVMVFNMAGGMMANLTEPLSTEVDFRLNQEGISTLIPTTEDDSTTQIVKLVGDILNSTSFRAAVDQTTVEVALNTGDAPLISLGVRNDENGITAVSNLLEGKALNLSAETVKALQEQMASEDAMGQINNMINATASLDKEAALTAFFASMDQAVAGVKEKAGEAEKGEYMVDELSFISKAPVDMNDQEIITLLLNAMKGYVNQEQFAQLYSMMGENNNPAALLDQAIEKIQNRPEEEAYATTVALYSNEDGEEYVAADLVREAGENNPRMEIHMGFGTEFANHRINMNLTQDDNFSFITMNLRNAESFDMAINVTAPDSMEMFVNMVKTPGRMADGVMGVHMNGLFVRVLLDQAEYAGEGRNGYHGQILATHEDENVEDPTDYEIGTIDLSWGKSAALTSVFSGEGIQQIALEPMMQGEGQEDQATLMGSAMSGVMKALSALIANLPEDSAAMVNGLLQGMMGTPAE